jgi:hypothetical protein
VEEKKGEWDKQAGTVAGNRAPTEYGRGRMALNAQPTFSDFISTAPILLHCEVARITPQPPSTEIFRNHWAEVSCFQTSDIPVYGSIT